MRIELTKTIWRSFAVPIREITVPEDPRSIPLSPPNGERAGVRGSIATINPKGLSRFAAKKSEPPHAGSCPGFAIALLLPLLALLALTGCGKSETAGTGEAKYYCPMHPTYTSDRPGDCPICHMKLVPVGEKTDSGSTPSVPGRTAVMLSAEKRQLIGLTTSAVEERELSQTVRGVATVIHDETRFARIAPRFGGWVRSVQVNYTGQSVKQGDPLFTVYSPELFTAGNDYLLALRQVQSATNDPVRLDAARHLLESARRRLELLQLGDTQIKALEQSGQARDELQIAAPLSGHVITRNAVEGQAFNAGEMLYEIADLSHLWVRATVFEFDLSHLRIGQPARILFPHLNDRTVESEIRFVYPHIDPVTRRGEVRLELDNPEHLFRPDMWASVEIEVSKGRVLTVPASAVIDTGLRHIAFADREDQHLEPREVKIGMRTDDYVQVLEGLKEGERVVTRALFLVDSESQLKAVISGMSGD